MAKAVRVLACASGHRFRQGLVQARQACPYCEAELQRVPR